MLERIHRLAHSLLAAKNPATYQMLHRISLFLLRVIRCLPPPGGGCRWHGGGGTGESGGVTACGGRRLISLEGGNRGQDGDEVRGGYGDWILGLAEE